MRFPRGFLIDYGGTNINGAKGSRVVIHALPRVANPVNPVFRLLLLVWNPCLADEYHSVGTVERDGGTACLDVQEHHVLIT